MKERSAAKTVSAMIIATLFSKLLGMARQIIFASKLGDSIYAVAFASASKITLSVFDILFSAAILACFIPFYGRLKKHSEDEARGFSSSFLTFTVVLTAALAAVGAVLSRQLISVFAPMLSDEASSLAAQLLSIMFPMMIFTAAAYVLVGILQSHDSFIFPSIISLLSNVVIIVFLLFYGDIADKTGIKLLAATYVLSWFLQFATLTVPLIRKRLMPGFSFQFKRAGVFDALKMSPAVIVGAWLMPASTLITNFFASFVSDASVAVFDYSISVWLIASGVLTYGVCNFIFPKLSAVAEDEQTFIEAARGGIKAALLLSLPVTVGLWLLGDNVICLLYLRGNFSRELADACGKTLSILAWSTPAYCITELLSRVFYSKKTAKFSMIASVGGVCVFFTCCAASRFLLDAGIDGIAVSFCIGQWAAAGVSIVFAMINITGFICKSDIKKIFFGAVSAALPAVLGAVLSVLLKKDAANLSTFQNFLVCAIVFSGECVLYYICIKIFGLLPKKQKKEV